MNFNELLDLVLDTPKTLLRRMVGEGLDIQMSNPKDGGTLLHEIDHPNIIQTLVELGLDVNAPDHEGWAPLHLAVDAEIDGANQSGEPAKFQWPKALIQAGADELKQDARGRIPRDIAVGYGAAALRLYDKASLMDWSGEPSLSQFAERCLICLKDAGFNVRLLDELQISVARDALGHDHPHKHFYLRTVEFYHLRREDGLVSLMESVGNGLEKV